MEDYQIQILTAFFAFLGGWGLSLLNDRRHKIQNLKTAYTSLLYELKEQKGFLDNRTTKVVTSEGPNAVHTSGIVLGISRYESLLYSGMFRHLDYDVQDLAVAVYGKMKNVNHASAKIMEFAMSRVDSANPDLVRTVITLGEQLEKSIEEIKLEIPKMIKLVEERMPTAIL